jgi:hypothetical protein
MTELFASGHAIDLVIAVLALEVLVVRVWMRRRHALPWPTLVAGLCLLLAWRFAQSGAHWAWVALPLSAAGLAHAVDLRHRWSDK